MKERGLLERPNKRGTRLIREKGLFGCHDKIMRDSVLLGLNPFVKT